MNSVKKARTAYIVYSAVLILIGGILILFPDMSSRAAAYLIGGFIAISGIIRFIDYFVNDTYGLAFQFDFALGIFAFLIGVILLLHPGESLAFIDIIIGLFVITDGTLKLQTAKEAKQFGLNKWWTILLLAVLTSIAGLLLVFNPFEGTIALTIILGVALITYGIENLCVALCAIKLIKRFGSSCNITK